VTVAGLVAPVDAPDIREVAVLNAILTWLKALGDTP
jgi:hypothetical protein